MEDYAFLTVFRFFFYRHENNDVSQKEKGGTNEHTGQWPSAQLSADRGFESPFGTSLILPDDLFEIMPFSNFPRTSL